MSETKPIDIRQVPECDFPEAVALMGFAFQIQLTPEATERWVRETQPGPLWGAYVDGRLAAVTTFRELKTWIQGKSFDMGGVAGVATWPEYRRGGLVARLLAQGLATMRQQGRSVSFLAPFSFPFYRKYGWELLTEYKAYDIPVALLPKLPPQPGRIERLVGEPDYVLLDRMYEPYAAKYNGPLVRDEYWWKERVLNRFQGTAVVYYDEAGEPAGYVLYDVKEQKLTVHELVFLHHRSQLALLKFLADHDSMIQRLLLKAPADDRLSFLLGDPRFKQEITPYFMARIVDVAAFLEQYPFAAGKECTLAMEIADGTADWNNKTFVAEVDESGTARIANEGAGSGVPTIRCDIQTLTALLLGSQSAAWLHEIGRLEGSFEAIELLEQLIPARSTYFLDYF